MSAYLWIKLVHILSATILFGTGLGIAFFMLKAYFGDNESAMVVTARNVVTADAIFTAPAVVIQLVTGVWLTQRLGISFKSQWFVSVIALFALVGLCWLPVVWIQMRIRAITGRGGVRDDYRLLMRIWVTLGVLALVSILALFYLMVSKTGAGRIALS